MKRTYPHRVYRKWNLVEIMLLTIKYLFICMCYSKIIHAKNEAHFIQFICEQMTCVFFVGFFLCISIYRGQCTVSRMLYCCIRVSYLILTC